MSTKDISSRNPYTPGVNAQESLYLDAFGDGAMAPKPYEPNTLKLGLALKEYETAADVKEAYDKATNKVTKALALAGISSDMSRNPQEMLMLIASVPEAIQHADESLRTSKEFLERAIATNPLVYTVLPNNLQQKQEMINAYARSMCDRGCEYKQRMGDTWTGNYEREPDEEVKLFKYAIDKNCPAEKFYSPENYQVAYEAMIKNDEPRTGYHGNPKDFAGFPYYSGDVAFVYMAQLTCGQDPVMKAQYQWAEAQAVVANIEHMAEKIQENPSWRISRNFAEAIAMAANTIEYPPIELQQMGIRPNPEQAQLLLAVVERAEHDHWVDRGKEATELLNQLSRGESLSWFNYYQLDNLMDVVEQHPEMGIAPERVSAYWEVRGEHLQDLIQNGANPNQYDVQRLTELSQRHPEMRVGEQLSIEGFDSQDRGDR